MAIVIADPDSGQIGILNYHGGVFADIPYDIRKKMPGQEIVEKITIYADACQYATDEMLAARDVVTHSGTSIPSSGIGAVITLTTGDATLFDASGVGDPTYMRLPSGEIVEITITDADTVVIAGRELFGTTASAQSGVLACRILHKGEADGTCYGYAGTCSSVDSWHPTAKRALVWATAPLPAGQKYSNGLRSNVIQREGPEVHPGQDMGTRARLRFTLEDETDLTDQFNPYRDRIAPGGTKIGKMLARHPFFNNRKIEYAEGLRNVGTLDEPEWVTRGYVIDTFSDPDGGKSQVVALDPVIMSEDKKAKIPKASTGKLAADMVDATLNFSYTDAPEYHYGPMSSGVVVRIDSENIRCTVSGAMQLTREERAFRSEQKDHKAGATIQICKRWVDTHVIDAIVDTLENYTPTPAEYIGDYSAVIDLIPAKVIEDKLITKPTACNEIINDLIKCGNLTYYFDEIDQQIVIDHLPELDIEPISLNDVDHFKQETVKTDRNESKQYTRHTMLWAPYDETKDSDEYFQVSHTVVNATLESERYIGSPNEKATHKSKVLGNSPSDNLMGVEYVQRTIDQCAEIPYLLTAELDAENIGTTPAGSIVPGAVISVATRSRQNQAGEKLSELYQINRISGTIRTGFKMLARRYTAIAPDDIDFVVEGEHVHYNLAEHFAPEDAGTYIIYVDPNCVCGSTNTAIPAFTTGEQAPGVQFYIIHRGKFLGMGGKGGDGGTATSGSNTVFTFTFFEVGVNGSPGGPAMEITVPCQIDTGSGIIWAGGGGGGGGGSVGFWQNNGGTVNPYMYSSYPGDGGGGGNSFVASAPGFRGFSQLTEIGATGVTITYGVTGSAGTQSSTTAGHWGEAGPIAPVNPLWTSGARATGGAGGLSIKTNGNALTILAGNNPLNIKGAVF
jgi:hypothetical protein